MSLYTPLLEEGLQGVHTSLKSHDDAEEPVAQHAQDRKGILIARVVGCEGKAGAHRWESQLRRMSMAEEGRVGRRVERRLERLPATKRH